MRIFLRIVGHLLVLGGLLFFVGGIVERANLYSESMRQEAVLTSAIGLTTAIGGGVLVLLTDIASDIQWLRETALADRDDRQRELSKVGQ